MKKKAIMIVLIVAAIVMILGSVFLFIHISSRDNLNYDIHINSQGEAEKVLSIQALNLAPGQTRQYTLNLLSQSAKEYRIRLNFIPKGSGTLQNFITVEIKAGDVAVTRPLHELFDGTTVDIDSRGADKIFINYIMPENVGNEAQGAQASFDIRLTVSRM